jgi:50S ribosomal protein L16 3-hydroxylase
VIEINAAKTGIFPLGMKPEKFLREYWQKKPLLIRNAFPNFETPVQPEDLAGLACEEGVLARIVSNDAATDKWTLRTGPFAEEDFPTMPDHHWTLLVQDVDKWDADVAALLQHFRFLPRWRIDDVMISFAATHGSVGAHVDHYDVFLLQAQGQRRWLIDAGKNPPLGFRDDAEIKLLRKFTPSHDWVLNPGDMLYLPPNVPHHGVAVNPCLTISVGLRAPSSAELLSAYVDDLVACADEGVRYHDEDLALPKDIHRIDDNAMRRVAEAVNALRMRDADEFGNWFGRFITTYRNAGDIVAEGEPLPRAEVELALRSGALLQRNAYARMAWRKAKRGAMLFCCGLEFASSVKDASRLADAEMIDYALYAGLSQTGRDVVLELLESGHYQCAE